MGTRQSSTNQNSRFASIPSVQMQRSQFDRSHGHKTTFDAGYLVPFFIDEVLPGDTFNVSTSIYARVATLLFPIMDNISLDVFYFFVPNRLLWENWERFNGAQDDPGASTDYLIPTMTSQPGSSYSIGSLHDHLTMPIGIEGITHSALWHRGYNLIWNEFFRDENLQERAVVSINDGPDDPDDYNDLLKRGKRHDYFTSCLPWPQKGPSVDIPIGTTAPVVSVGDGEPFWDSGAVTDIKLRIKDDSSPGWDKNGPAGWNNVKWADTKLEADLTNATAATINALRQAFQIQRMYERDARGGTRYTEILRSHFGVTSADQRLQRPEYLGGGSQALMVTPTPTTSAANSQEVGTLRAFGTISGTGMGFTKSFTEHGIVIGLVASRADVNYAAGLQRMFSRQTRFDFYWPSLAHIGEQAVINGEIYAQGDGVSPREDEDVFGYQERYAEYRYKPNAITGLMRPGVPGTLDAWHVTQEFMSLPTLSSDFIVEDPALDRVIAIPSEPHFIFDCFIQFKCARPMPTYGVPGMIDHF